MTCPCLVPETCDVPLFGQRVFADVVKLRISRGVHPGLSGWALRPVTNVFKRDRREDTQSRNTPGGRSQVKMDAELGVTQPQAKGPLASPSEERCPLEPSEGAQP